jgi:hypothetical protein
MALARGEEATPRGRTAGSATKDAVPKLRDGNATADSAMMEMTTSSEEMTGRYMSVVGGNGLERASIAAEGVE